MVGGGEEEGQQRVASQVVEVEAVAAVPRLVRDAEHRGEGGVFGKADGPLVEGAVGVRGDHEDVGGEDAEAQAAAWRGFSLATIADEGGGGVRQRAAGRPLSAMLDGEVDVLVAGVHDHATAERVGVVGRERHGDTGHK